MKQKSRLMANSLTSHFMFTKYEKKMNCSPGLPRTFVTKRSQKTPNSYHNDVFFFLERTFVVVVRALICSS